MERAGAEVAVAASEAQAAAALAGGASFGLDEVAVEARRRRGPEFAPVERGQEHDPPGDAGTPDLGQRMERAGAEVAVAASEAQAAAALAGGASFDG
jgi:hypothetical protein